MGIFHSTTRILASKPRDEEEGENPSCPNLQNRCKKSHGDSSLKTLIFFSSIYKAAKGLLQKVFNFSRPRKTAHHFLPIQNQTASSVPLLISLTDDDEAQCENVGEQNCSNALVSSDFDQEIVEEIAPANFPSSSSFRVEENYSAARNEIDHDAVVSVPQMRCSKIKHYSNRHRILLVGEGDFSFSACLAVAFGSATNIIATSLNNTAFLKKNYGSALSNIEEVTSRGGKVMHGIDATEIGKHEFLRQLKFDRIVFNFPFAGFFPKSSPEFQLRQHRRLVSRFLKNAKEMMSENGEIHISNKTNGVNAEFNVQSIASSHGLRLIAAVKFKCSNYPGYNTKYGIGGDKNFNCYPSKTFKFGLKT
ncbi:hypothetical protein C2S51_009955 [Perilla frutescens var. frutescens]|nr:hypothetical protein C2S51_009955 [Perilla frutescens var. frutescens]